MSSVPEAVDHCVQLFSTVMDTVEDGVPQVWPDQDALIIGGSRDGRGITLETNPAGMGQPDNEVFGITCVIVVVGGDAELKPLRDRAFAYYNAIATKLRQDKSLGGAVAYARLSSAEVAQFLNESGGAVELTFVILCTAYV